jgi:hypothetical protein
MSHFFRQLIQSLVAQSANESCHIQLIIHLNIKNHLLRQIILAMYCLFVNTGGFQHNRLILAVSEIVELHSLSGIFASGLKYGYTFTRGGNWVGCELLVFTPLTKS